jgi:uncharacterized protein DUF4942
MDGMPLFSDAQPPAAHSNIVPRATVRDMVKRRALALAAFGELHAAMEVANAAFDKASAAHRAIDQRAREDSYMNLTRNEERHFLKRIDVPKVADFLTTARKVVDRRMWSVLIELTELERLMDKQAKDRMRQDLMDEVPEATEENIFATLQTFAADADMIFKRGIANCFMALDRRFRSHDGWEFGSRVILDRALNDSGHWSYSSNQGDTLHDIERTFSVLDGNPMGARYGGIVETIRRERPGYKPHQSEHESEYFKVRCYMNGNAHVWFKRDDLLKKVNALLGEYYGAPIPEERAPDEDTGLHQAKTSLAKNYGFFPTPEGAVDDVFQYAPTFHRRDDDAPPLTVLEPSAGTGNLARRAVKCGAIVDCVEYQPALAAALRESGLYRAVWAADFLARQPYPASLYDRVVMNPPFDRERDIDHVMHALKFLKPDGCLVAVMSAGTEFRQTRKSAAFRALMDKMGGTWRDLPAGSFASVGTNTNTVILRVWNDSRRQSRW